MATKNRQIEFLILPHLKKYIYKFYKLNTDEPVEVTMTNSIGIAMKHVLREKKKIHGNYVDRLRDRITFRLSSDLSNLELRMGFILNFNLHYDRIFKENMRQWVMAQWECGINNRQALMNFLKHYNIKENEYSYENAQRDWLRFKNERPKAKVDIMT